MVEVLCLLPEEVTHGERRPLGEANQAVKLTIGAYVLIQVINGSS